MLLDVAVAGPPTDGNQASWVATGLQTASTIMVAALLWLLRRVIVRRFLALWTLGWLALALGLIALNISFHFPQYSRLCHSIYWVAGDLFGFLLFAGCRDYAQGTPLRWPDAWLFVPPIVIGVILPGYFRDFTDLFPAHALFFGGYSLLAFATTLHARTREGQTLIGLRLLQISLFGLVVLFWHYAVVLGWRLFAHGDSSSPEYMKYSSLYDAFMEMALAFAQVVLATDSVRRELTETNRQLAAATEQLAHAARTDALTGLLNRRAFDAMLTDPNATPAPGSIAAIDVNDLKPLNDRLGHAAGDGALRTVARILQARTRLGDPVFRLGGDEFLVLLSGVSTAELTRRLHDADQALLHSRLPGLPTPVDISIAWGVSEYRDRVDLPAAVDRADAAMYAAKQAHKAKTGG